MLIEDALFNEDCPLPGDWSDCVVRSTQIDGLVLEGLNFEGIMDRCVVTSTEFYWGTFICALLTRTRFEACRFLGASFRGCTLVGCEFVDCTFALDNLGGDCTLDDCLLASCSFTGSTWIARPGRLDRDGRDITRTRWLACTQSGCTGLEGLF